MNDLMNPKTKSAVDAMALLGAKYVKRTPAHVYFDVPHSWTKAACDKLAKTFIQFTGIGVKMRRVKE